MTADLTTLLAESEWLVRLARSLCGDAAEADEVVQEVYVAALRSPPDAARPHRPWLRRVVHNVLRMRHRTRMRRLANDAVMEQVIEPAARPDDIVARTRLERRLTELVLELDEPYRTTVLLRYREGLTAELIAKRQGVPAGTVRRRLKTAIDRLRVRLDEHDTRWRAVLAPGLAMRPQEPRWRRWVMAKLMVKVVVAIVAAAVLAQGIRWWAARGPRREEVGAGEGGVRVAERVPVTTSPAVFVQPGVVARSIDGIVVADGKPFAGATVRLADSETRAVLAEATTAVDGRFTFGARAAAAYDVTAEAAGKLAAQHVDLRAPPAPLELRLVGCNHLEGLVLDGSGAPIAHARVARLDAPSPSAETDTHGHYDLCTRFGWGEFEYTASGYGGMRVRLQVDTTTRDVVLLPEATLAGTVVAPDGTPVGDAWITVDGFDKTNERRAPVRAHTDADGTFRIAGVAAGRSQVSAIAPGLASHRIEVVAGPGQVLERLVVKLEHTARLTAVVRAGDVPVVGAGIGIRVGSLPLGGTVGLIGTPGPALAVTQADGSFTIDRVPFGDVALWVDGYTVTSPRVVHVAADHVSTTVAVDTLATVRGQVVHDGAPVADALVECPGQTGTTDGKGEFTCTGVMPGPCHVIAFARDGRWGETTVTAARAETTTADVRLDHDAALCGHVVDGDGKPLRGLEVDVLDPRTGDSGNERTSATGAFCARWLAGNADYQIAVYSGGQRLELRAPAGVVALRAGRTDVTIVTSPPALTIAGTVVDPAGAPIADAIVRAQASDRAGARVFADGDAMAITDATGRFELARLAPGTYTVLATAADGSERIVEPVTAGARDLAITLEPAGRIEGTLVGFSSAPVITGGLQSNAHPPIDAEVDGTRFHASGLSPGTYVLTAETGREGDTQKVTVRAGETTTVTMTSRGTATIDGRVIDFKTRAPIAGARCRAVTRHGDDVGVVYNTPDDTAVADVRGRFTIEAAPAGEIVVACSGAEIRYATRLAVAPRDRTTTVEVVTVAPTGEQGTIDARFEFLQPRIAELTMNGAAARAGLLLGDEVVEVDGASVAELAPGSIMALVTQRPAGSPARLTVRRGNELRVIAVTVRAADR